MAGSPAAFAPHAFNNAAFQTGESAPVILPSSGAGGGYRKGERRKRGLEWDKRDTAQDVEKWLREAYADLTGEKQVTAVAETVAEVVAPYVQPKKGKPSIDWSALARSTEAIKRLIALYDEHMAHKRRSEEEAAFMLLMQ